MACAGFSARPMNRAPFQPDAAVGTEDNATSGGKLLASVLPRLYVAVMKILSA